MNSLILLFVFIFGSIIGSFLNVVILRYNTGRSIVSGRSICFSCGTRLHWYNMFPIFSFLLQGGKCHSCLSKVSWQYPLVEFVTAVLYTMLYLKLGPTLDFIFYAFIFSVLTVIAVYDFRHKIIPDELVYLLITLGFLRLAYVYSVISPDMAISGFLAGSLMFLFLGSFWFFSGGAWMGLGDAKLVLALGWLSTFCYALTSLVYSFWLGAIIGIFINLFFKRIKEVPFAPFLIVGFLVVFFYNSNLFSYLGSTACIK
ncbi:MAG: prepilin peptidase [bacterium]|nr:prepilin peptidase [bacterium]